MSGVRCGCIVPAALRWDITVRMQQYAGIPCSDGCEGGAIRHAREARDNRWLPIRLDGVGGKGSHAWVCAPELPGLGQRRYQPGITCAAPPVTSHTANVAMPV